MPDYRELKALIESDRAKWTDHKAKVRGLLEAMKRQLAVLLRPDNDTVIFVSLGEFEDNGVVSAQIEIGFRFGRGPIARETKAVCDLDITYRERRWMIETGGTTYRISDPPEESEIDNMFSEILQWFADHYVSRFGKWLDGEAEQKRIGFRTESEVSEDN